MFKKLFFIGSAALLLVSAHPASAASLATEIQTQIKSLLGSLQDSTDALAGCAIPSAPLALGSYGPEVKKLQIWLNQHGYTVVPSGKESQYFGPLTHFAVIRFQTAAGIRPVSGFYGSLTMNEIKKRCASEVATGFQVSLAAGSPKGGAVPADAVRVELLRFSLTGKGVLNSLAVRRTGAARSSTFDDLYLYDGDVRLTSGLAFDREANAVAFADLALPISGTRTLSVMADIASADDIGPDGVEIASAEAVGAQGTVTGSFPIRGGLFTRSERIIGTLEVMKNGTLIDPVVGQRGVQAAEFRVVPDIREDVLLRSIALTSDGSLEQSSLSNFVLKQGDATVALASTVNTRNQILLMLDKPMALQEALPLTFKLFADVSATAEPGKTIRIYLKSPVDMHVTENKTGQGVRVIAAKYNNSAKNGTDASWLTVRGGVATFGFRGPAVANYAAKQVNAELMSFSLTAEQNISVREIRVMLSAGGDDASSTLTTAGGLCNGAAANYTDIKLVDATTGEVLTRPQTTTCVTGADDASQTLVFKDSWIVPAKQTRVVKVMADIGSFVPAANETIRATLLAFKREDIRNTDTGYYLGTREVVPEGNLVGATHRVHATPAAADAASAIASLSTETLSN